jgi:putative ABC transport system substrate-binding protein
MINRRTFLHRVALGTLASPLAAEAQHPEKSARIGYLVTGSLESPRDRSTYDAFRQGLREHGYVEGSNIVIEYRAANGKIERFQGLATELVRLQPDLIVAVNTPAARAVRLATTSIPIVVPLMAGPVGDGLVASLARPGGNITGLTFLGPELVPKRLELLREAVPGAARVAALWHPGAFGERATRDMLKETEATARTLGVRLQFVGVRGADELERAFSMMTRERAQALIVFPSPMLFVERRRIVDLAARHRLPSMSTVREFVELGGLIAYGASVTDLLRRAATYVARILKGAKPSELPVEQPTKFELVISLKTAKALGLAIPQSVLARADEVLD